MHSLSIGVRHGPEGGALSQLNPHGFALGKRLIVFVR